MTKNKKYTHIFFDLDNTLWDFENNSKKAMFSTFSFFKLQEKVDFERFFSVYSAINHQLWDDYRNNQLAKKDLIRLRFQKTFDELHITGIDPVEMNEHYLAEMPKQNQLIDGATEVIEYLRRKNCMLYIITNGFKEVQYKKMEATGLKFHFSKVFISEEIKSAKPGREIFEFAIKSANAPKSSSIMIGDDWEVDIIGALDFGIDAVYLKNDSSESYFENHSKCKLYQINLLTDLMQIL